MAMAEGREIVVPITALGPTLGATVVWRTRGQLYVTVVVKATFALVADAEMRLTAPDPLVRDNVFPGGLPNRSAIATSELAPYLARADITFTGHAYAPPGRPALTQKVRFGVIRDRALLDKTLMVCGDRSGDGAPRPFVRIPISYDRAFGGLGWAANPFGVGFEDPDAHPNILPPTGERATAGLGPIASVWLVRQRRLGTMPRKALSAPIVEIPDSFDWAYFQSAPEDQLTDFLAGDEWVLLEGLHPELPGIRSRLPDARGAARIHGLTPSSPELARQIDLRADMLIVNGDRQTCSIVWRSPVPVRDEATLAGLRIVAGVTIHGHDAALQVKPPPPQRTEEPSPDLSGTLALSDDKDRAAERPALPFGAGAPRGSVASEPPRAGASSTLVLEPPGAPSSSATLVIDGDEPNTLKAKPALPFTPGHPGAPPPAPSQPSSPRPSSTSAPRAPRDDFGSTVTLSIEDEDRATMGAATPFEQGSWIPEPPRDHPSATSIPPAMPAPPPAEETQAPVPDAREEATKTAAKRPTTHEGIELWNDTGLSLGAVPASDAPAGKRVVVIVKATCDLVPKGPAAVRSRADPLERDRFYEGERGKSSAYPTDFATHKARADVVLLGHAYAPGGSASVMDVSFKFGHPGAAFARRLRVFGDRVWEKGRATMKPSEPAHFDQIPIRYDRAFGGLKYAANPVGLGLVDPTRLEGAAVQLPNLEDPDRLLRTPSQKVPPACFAPVLGAWRKRGGAAGDEDDPWPALDGDAAATRYQAAPLEQQLDSLKGDEPYELTGLHPRHPVIAGSLPGLRARVFAERRPAPAEIARFEEVKLTLDTVIFDVDAAAVHLVLRGAVPVADPRAPDIAALFLAVEEAGARAMSLDEARSKLDRSRPR